jgi:enterochelin esterase-like enzyme
MKIVLKLCLLLSLVCACACRAQTNSDDAVSASSNVPGAQFPKIDSNLRVTFRFHAPKAQKVQINLDKSYDMARDTNGDWNVTTRPQVPGFHYYWLVVDGASLCDPASETFYGVGKETSGIEIPSPGEDFYDVKNVPHGEIRERWYFAKTTGTFRRVFIYTPPDYDNESKTRYPVLYLQHGGGEDERGWVNQGRLNFIMDNLIVEKKVLPMIIVMGKGTADKAGEPEQILPFSGGPRGSANQTPANFGQALGEVMVNDLIPMIDSTYRTIPDREHRAMAGLSMGGTETFQITQDHLDQFAWIGVFSAPFGFPDIKTGYNGLLAKPDEFSRQVKLLFISMGGEEAKGIGRGSRTFHEALDKAGVKNVYYESPGTAHEWQTWRRSLHEFAPLLFQN